MTSAAFTPIVDDDATLRLLAVDDLPLTLAWRNHEESRLWFHSTDPISETSHDEWFAKYLDRADDYVFLLEISGTLVAQASLYGIEDGAAEFGRLLVDPGQRGKGFAPRAIALCLRVADDILGLDHLHLEVKRDNLRAIRSYEMAGFRPDESRRGIDDALAMVRHRS